MDTQERLDHKANATCTITNESSVPARRTKGLKHFVAMARNASLILLILVAPGWAEDFTVYGGGIWNLDTRTSYNWQMEYNQELGEHFATSLTYLNEGHLPNHHRDGQALQFWGRTNLYRQFAIAAGAGPYFYYDTTSNLDGSLDRDHHGWGALASLAATWYTESPWLYQLRTNVVATNNGSDTVGVLFGLGYRLDQPQSLELPAPVGKKTTDNEIGVFLGQAVVNNADVDSSSAWGIEYRRGLWQNLDWTASWLYEGGYGLTERQGLASQLWLVKAFFDDSLTLGFGGGGYAASDRLRDANDGGSDIFLAGIVSMTGSYRIDSDWGVRATWNRIITNYDRDSDLWLGGIFYRF